MIWHWYVISFLSKLCVFLSFRDVLQLHTEVLAVETTEELYGRQIEEIQISVRHVMILCVQVVIKGI